MSRLDYAPKLKEIVITDIKKGLGVFTPKPDGAVSFAALKATLKKAGYTLDSAEIVVSGALRHEGNSWWLVAQPSGQRCALEGAGVEKVLAGAESGTRLEVTGDWKTEGSGAAARLSCASSFRRRLVGDVVASAHKPTAFLSAAS